MSEFFLLFETTVDKETSDPIGWMVDNLSDFSFRLSGPVISSLVVMLLVAICAIIAGIQAKHQDPLKPAKGMLFLFEWAYDKIHDWAKGIMGKEPGDMVGYFMGLFIYLFLAFIWSMTGMAGTIDYLVVPLSLSIVMFVLIQATALRYQKWKYFHRYIEPVVIWLPINLVTMWTPIISTALRMFGNALAGSVIIGLINWATKSASYAMLGAAIGDGAMAIGLGPVVIGVLNLYFGLFSGFIQTLVFASLNAVWIGQEMPENDAMGTTRQATRPDAAKEAVAASHK